jgi:hypothetical protein
VIGVEANTRLVMMLTEIEKPGQPTSYVRWLQSNTSVREMKASALVREMKASALAIKANPKRTLIINAAAGRGGGARNFNTGSAQDDTGSLFSSSRSGSSPGAVPMVPLGHILQYVPLHLRWDVLKIDVQARPISRTVRGGSAKYRDLFPVRLRCLLSRVCSPPPHSFAGRRRRGAALGRQAGSLACLSYLQYSRTLTTCTYL